MITDSSFKSKAQRVLNNSNQTIDLMNNQGSRKRGRGQGGAMLIRFCGKKSGNRNRQPISSGPQIFEASGTFELSTQFIMK